MPATSPGNMPAAANNAPTAQPGTMRVGIINAIRTMPPNFYYTTAGSYIEMRFKPDSGICKQFIINQTSPQYTTAGSYIKGANIKAVTSPSVVGSRSLAVFVPEQGRFDNHISGVWCIRSFFHPQSL